MKRVHIKLEFEADVSTHQWAFVRDMIDTLLRQLGVYSWGWHFDDYNTRPKDT